MRTTLLVIAMTLCICLSACGQKGIAPAGEPKRYELKGKVMKLDRAQKRIEVAHEKIEGFMEAMTMPFAVKDDTNFAKLQLGDQITATLVYNPNDNRSWLENLKTSP